MWHIPNLGELSEAQQDAYDRWAGNAEYASPRTDSDFDMGVTLAEEITHCPICGQPEHTMDYFAIEEHAATHSAGQWARWEWEDTLAYWKQQHHLALPQGPLDLPDHWDFDDTSRYYASTLEEGHDTIARRYLTPYTEGQTYYAHIYKGTLYLWGEFNVPF